jgi:ribosomal protein L11 methyltransferase
MGSSLKTHPAIDVHGGTLDLILANADDFGPSAVEERGQAVRLFFSTRQARDSAGAALGRLYEIKPVDVPDEDWARRSQQNLEAITVGRITILPGSDWRPVDSPLTPESRSPESGPQATDAGSGTAHPITIVIEPSMGFGTGHHATTRLCLTALQAVGVNGKSLLDVGTGSGVLAIAAARLGAAPVAGVDNDPDAIQSAGESLLLNPGVRVTFERADLTTRAFPAADVVTANLTGAFLARTAPVLLATVRSGGILIISGLLASERHDVCCAFAPAAVIWEQQEDGWVGIAFRTP